MIVALAGWAWAAVPLPSYREELVRQRWAEVDEILREGCTTDRFPVACAPGVVDRAVAHADTFQDAVTRDPSLEYLVGLAYRYGGREDRAIERYRAALALAPDRAEAWYDLGEIYMTRARYAEATDAFEHVRDLVAGTEHGWLGPWRLAEVAALQHDPIGFERNIKAALREGFSFRQVAGQDNWRGFYADPALRDTLDKLLTVYATPEIRDSLR
ncbi:MAG: tetratricopeptide repeat protein [Myxococcota bacterium]